MDVYELFQHGYDSPSVFNFDQLEDEFRRWKVAETNKQFYGILKYITNQLILVYILAREAILKFDQDLFSTGFSNEKAYKKQLRLIKMNKLLLDLSYEISHFWREGSKGEEFEVHSRKIVRFFNKYREALSEYYFKLSPEQGSLNIVELIKHLIEIVLETEKDQRTEMVKTEN